MKNTIKNTPAVPDSLPKEEEVLTIINNNNDRFGQDFCENNVHRFVLDTDDHILPDSETPVNSNESVQSDPGLLIENRYTATLPHESVEEINSYEDRTSESELSNSITDIAIVVGSVVDEELLRSEDFYADEVSAGDVFVMDSIDDEAATPLPRTIENISVYNGQIVKNPFELDLQMGDPVCLRYPRLTHGRLLALFLLFKTLVIISICTFVLISDDSSSGVAPFRSPVPTASSVPSSVPSSASLKVSWVRIRPDVDVVADEKGLGWLVALSDDGVILFAAGGNGILRAYENGDEVWSVASDPSLKASDSSFLAVRTSSDGLWLVVSVVKWPDTSGSVKVFHDDGGRNWERFGTELSGEKDKDFFGYSLAITDDGKTLAVGALGCDYVKLFDRNGNEFSLRRNIRGVPSSEFGTAVSMSVKGSVIIVGTPNSFSGRGDVTVFDSLTGISKWRIYGKSNEKYLGFSLEATSDGSKIATMVQADNVISFNVYELDVIGDRYVQIGDTTKLSKIPFFPNVARIAISADGGRVAVGVTTRTGDEELETGKTFVFSVDDDYLRLIGEIMDVQDNALGMFVALSKDGKRLAVSTSYHGSGSQTGFVRMYESFRR